MALWRGGQGRGRSPLRGWQVQGHLNKGPLTAGQKDAVKLILSAKDRTVGVQGYAGTGKTTMLNRARTLAEKKGWRMAGLAPSASAAQTLASEAGIETETLQRFLARNAGVAEGRLTRKGAREMRAAFAKTILVVDEGSLASTVQASATCSGSRTRSASPAWCWWAMPSSSTPWTRASPSPSSRPPACRPPRWMRSCASAIRC